jgi:D-alanyl-D-alanine carboxypeptidase/D-alanyl-D-alanine-endopeptidase (penicillin-binding protein 4)
MPTRRLLLLFTVMLTLSASVDAAPTAEIALDRYRLALEDARLDLDRQGVLFETLDGKPLLAYNVDCPFNPASVVKLATSDVALARLGPNHRFGTAFYTNGALDSVSGTLVGDLIVVGSGDPSVTTEHAFHVARELRARGIRIITGNVVVKGPLYCNYSMNRESAGSTIIAALDVERWNGSIEYAFGRYQTQTRQTSFESVVVEGDVVVANDTNIAGLTPLFTLRSMPLVKILKQLNNFSNNWMAHVIGNSVGGASGVRQRLGTDVRIPFDEFRLQTTSGLGSNAMRPNDVVAMLRHLQSRLATSTLTPAHLMPVAGVDPGTLEDRYLSARLRGAVVAKTGTLRSVSALAGYMYTRDRGVVVFAILNQGGTPAKFRRLQDQLVTEMFEACGGPAPIPYQRPFGYAETAGAFIERAPGNIPEAPPVAQEVSN